jgi:hypothetical protein
MGGAGAGGWSPPKKEVVGGHEEWGTRSGYENSGEEA